MSDVASLLSSTLGYAVDTADPAALKAALDRVNVSIASAEEQVVAAIEEERGTVIDTLGAAEQLRAQMEGLRADMANVPCETLHGRLEATVLMIPTLRSKLNDAKTQRSFLHSLSEVHQCLRLFESAMQPPPPPPPPPPQPPPPPLPPDLRAAEQHARSLRNELQRLEQLAKNQREHTPIVALIADESKRCEERLRESARASWAAAALGVAPATDPASDPGSSSLGLRSGGSVSFSALAATLHAAGLAEECVAELGEALLARLLKPALEPRAARVVVEEAAHGGGAGAAAAGGDDAERLVTLRLVGGAGDGGRVAPSEAGREASGHGAVSSLSLVRRTAQACDAIQAAVTAAHKFLAQADSSGGPQLRLGAAFWTALREAVCDDCLLPALAAELEAGGGAGGGHGGGRRLSEVGTAVTSHVEGLRKSLNQELRSDDVDAGMRLLSEAVSRLPLRAVGTRTAALLDEARAILLDESSEGLDSVVIGPSPRPWRQLKAAMRPKAAGGGGGGEAAKGSGHRTEGVAVGADDQASSATMAEEEDDDDEEEEEGNGGDNAWGGVAVGAPGQEGEEEAALTSLGLSKLVFPRCRVGARAACLLGLLHAALDCACACDGEGAALLYARSRDLIDLFLSSSALRWQAGELAPSSAPSRSVAFVPSTMLLLHNDALLLRHRCLTLGAEYAHRLPAPLGACAAAGDGPGGSGGDARTKPVFSSARASFVDLAPSLGDLAAKALRRVASAVRSQLHLALGPGRGFEHVGEDSRRVPQPRSSPGGSHSSYDARTSCGPTICRWSCALSCSRRHSRRRSPSCARSCSR